jgi:thiamine pyrophosphokinase
MIENNGANDNLNGGRYCVGIVLGGAVNDYDSFASELTSCDYVVCADGGAAHLAKINVIPDLLVGDFDSIDRQELDKLLKIGVPSRKYPPEKNRTDSELAVDAAIEFINTKYFQHGKSNRSDIRIILLAATGSRPDHVLANQLMAAGLAREGYDVLMSDGVSRFYFLNGPIRKIIDTEIFKFSFVVSAIALSNEVKGITYDGLKYPLNDFDLKSGSQRGISNRLDEKVPGGKKAFSVSIKSGLLLLIITHDK